MSETKVPSIPSVPSGLDPQLAAFLNAIREAMQVREGQRGQLLDAGVTFRDLVDLGVADTSGRIDPNAVVIRRARDAMSLSSNIDKGRTDTTIPPAPRGLRVVGAMTAIFLEWEWHTYYNHDTTEIWRNTTDTLVGATMVGTSDGRTYADSVGPNSTYYYWIRFKTKAGVTGPYNDQAGTLGKTEIDPEFAINAISGQITKSELAGSLRSSIGALEEAYVVKVKDVGGTEAVSGFGLAYEGEKSNFIVAADRFAIIGSSTAGNNDAQVPFSVLTADETTPDGTVIPAGVYLKTAYVKDASITSAKIANLEAEKLLAGTVDVNIRLNAATMYGAKMYGGTPYNGNYPLTIDGGMARFYTDGFSITDISGLITGTPFTVKDNKVYITSAMIQDGSIDNAKIGNTIQSDSYVAGSAGWKIDKTGQMEMNNATFRGTLDVKSAATGARLEIVGDRIRVYDELGRLRVTLGRL